MSAAGLWRISPEMTEFHPMVSRQEPSEWSPVGDGTPLNAWLETKRDGEKGTNICYCRLLSIGDEPEWVEREGGRTTVTHHTFAAPTHWRWPRYNDDDQPTKSI